ncbi:MAG: HlyD family efflux transporter periplasmic adaptor subunit [Chloroflexi bacterium]|nr:HlyD family efflux transporter periplasmic adaptor subunit [Chloroflexota bacterium]
MSALAAPDGLEPDRSETLRRGAPKQRENGAGHAQPAPGTRSTVKPRRLLALALLAVFLLAPLGWYSWRLWVAAAAPTSLTASGTVEAEEVHVGSEIAGRIVALPAEEGRWLRAGDVVARLDDTLITTQLRGADVAQRQQLEIQADRYIVRTPISGVVTKTPARVGEVAAPGQTLVNVSDLSQLKLTVYVLERDLGRVWVGQSVHVAADPFPGRTFSGVVTSINSRAEFTPRNVQTQRDRQNLVFGVKIRVDNPDGALKPGLPVDAIFLPGEP